MFKTPFLSYFRVDVQNKVVLLAERSAKGQTSSDPPPPVLTGCFPKITTFFQAQEPF